MSRPGSVPMLLLLLLPLLLTVAVADDYQWLDAVSVPGQQQPTVETSAARDCANQCEADKCSGFRYQPGYKTCHLYSADCRGPAANSAQRPAVTDLYMARNACPGSKSCTCGCPGGFRRYGARCLLTLDQPVTNVTEAAERCAALGAHLAVPRSEAENEQMILATTHYQTGDLALTWLGIEEVGGVWIGADGCGPIKQFFWAETQPDAAVIPWDEFHVAYSPPGLEHHVGWHTQPAVSPLTHRPLCQLASCYRPDCQ